MSKNEVEQLKRIFYPQSVAIIGASSNPDKIGGIILNNLISDRYGGKIYPINIRCGKDFDQLFGIKCYSSIREVPDNVDVAVIAVPAKYVPQTLVECGEKGVKGAIIISSGFAEIGEEGKKLQEEIVQIAKKYGIRIIGPNCMGIVNTHANLNLWFGLRIFKKGNIALVSQSGAFADGFYAWAIDENLSFSIVVSIGNRSDVDEADLLRFLKEDPNTKVIGIYVEGLPIGKGRRFLEALKETSAVIPVVILKAGKSRSGARATLSHTGSLAGSAEIYKAAFKQYGGIVVDTSDEFIDVLKALSHIERRKGKRIAILSNSGGLAILAADEAEKLELSVPEFPKEVKERILEVIPYFGNPSNPVDITAQGTPEEQKNMYCKVFEIINDPRLIDAVLVIIEGSYPLNLMSAIKDAVCECIAIRRKLPVVVAWVGSKKLIGGMIEEIEEKGLPVYPSPERAVRVLKHILS